jgi:FlaA1/EpsC-like NDP-sugar epimerase
MSIGKRNTPIWIIFLLDLFICFISIWLAYLLRFNFRIPFTETETLPLVFTGILLIRGMSFLVFQTHKSIIRFTNTKDAERILITIAIGSTVFIILNPIFYWIKSVYFVPYTIIIIDGMLSVFLMFTGRLVIKGLYQEFSSGIKTKSRVVIYGSSNTGIMAKRAIERDAGARFKVIFFIDDHSTRIGKKIQGINIKSSSELSEILQNNDIKLVILSSNSISQNKKQEIIDLCLANNTKVFSVPPVKSWINGELSFKQIKKININDLLERDPIQLDMDKISNEISNKTVLVTGAAGSIGSELVKQILRFNPKKLILLDQAESPLFEVERELLDELNASNYEIVIGDIRNYDRMLNVFNHFNPQLVFHAAAYKHVPLMENNPSEALFTNVKGTKILADLAVRFNVEKFVMVSTDKAVNPTNVMGATKRIAEIYVQSLNKNCTTKFITTRFGNVLGSNGSVIPLFKKQIERGGPVTVTHPEITRFFMTIPEACQLVLEAGAIGEGGEIFIFDMGKSVKIIDLARKMIKLYGLTVGKDIEINYSGLRPGEKLYEELLNDNENTLPTHHPQIMRAKVQEFDFEFVSNDIDDLIMKFQQQNNTDIVAHMKMLVPEYKSNNSIFEALDEN